MSFSEATSTSPSTRTTSEFFRIQFFVTDLHHYNRLPAYRATSHNPFPIAVACRNDEEAKPFMILKPYIDHIADSHFNNTQRILDSLDFTSCNSEAGAILEMEGTFYPVLRGKGGCEGIYFTL